MTRTGFAEDRMHQGSCLCGRIRFEVAGELAGIQLCHCSQCRRANGAAFAALLESGELPEPG